MASKNTIQRRLELGAQIAQAVLWSELWAVQGSPESEAAELETARKLASELLGQQRAEAITGLRGAAPS